VLEDEIAAPTLDVVPQVGSISAKEKEGLVVKDTAPDGNGRAEVQARVPSLDVVTTIVVEEPDILPVAQTIHESSVEKLDIVPVTALQDPSIASKNTKGRKRKVAVEYTTAQHITEESVQLPESIAIPVEAVGTCPGDDGAILPETKARKPKRGKRQPKATEAATEDVENSFVAGLKTRKGGARRTEVPEIPTAVQHVLEPAFKVTKKVARGKVQAASVPKKTSTAPQGDSDQPVAQATKVRTKKGTNAMPVALSEALQQRLHDIDAAFTAPLPHPTLPSPPALLQPEPFIAEPEISARGRPKRKAAVSAREKVTTGFEVEDVDVDRLRRGVGVVLVQGGGTSVMPVLPAAKTLPSPSAETPLSPPPTEAVASPMRRRRRLETVPEEVEVVPVKKGGRRGRKAGVMAEEASLQAEENIAVVAEEVEESALDKPVWKAAARARGWEAVVVKTEAEEAPTEDAKPMGKRKIARTTKAAAQDVELPEDIPAKEEAIAESTIPHMDGNEQESSMPPSTTRVRPAQARRARATGTTRKLPSKLVEPHEDPAEDQVNAEIPAQVAHEASTPLHTTKAIPPQPKRAHLAAAKVRKPLGETDANIVRISVSPEKAQSEFKDRASPAKEPPTPQAPAATLPSKTRKRFAPTSPEKLVVVKKRKPPPPLPPPTSASPPPAVTSRDAEDIDWLFAGEPDRERVQPAKGLGLSASRRGGKRAPLRFADRGCKDMDLDDLLETVAGVTQEVRTGSRRHGCL
jgi:hypothetical protein